MSSCARNIAHFLVFVLCAVALRPNLHSFGHTARPPAPVAVPIAPRGLSGIWCRPVQSAQRPGVCLALRGLCLASGAVCPAACRVQSFRVRWSGQGCTGGVYSRRPAPPGQSRHHRKNKKGSKNNHTPIIDSKNFPQKQKDPYKGSVFCAILALQALKGRNLQNEKADL